MPIELSQTGLESHVGRLSLENAALREMLARFASRTDESADIGDLLRVPTAEEVAARNGRPETDGP